MKKTWFLYIVQCSDRTLYTGITTDLERRVREHNSGDKGARYTRGRRPVVLVHCEKFSNRSDAAKREMKIKRMRREDKTNLFNG